MDDTALKEQDDAEDPLLIVFEKVSKIDVQAHHMTLTLTSYYPDAEGDGSKAGDVDMAKLLMDHKAARRLRDALNEALLIAEPAASDAKN